METTKCPKCGRTLPLVGEAWVNDQRFPVFSCDECIMKVRMFDDSTSEWELPLTFCLDAEGNAFDPADPTRRLDL